MAQYRTTKSGTAHDGVALRGIAWRDRPYWAKHGTAWHDRQLMKIDVLDLASQHVTQTLSMQLHRDSTLVTKE